MKIDKCQLCQSNQVVSAINLGHHPLADRFLSSEQIGESENTYPLEALLCEDCGYVFLSYVVSPEEKYQSVDYSYTSGNSPVSVKHFAELAGSVSDKIGLGSDDLVVDIGSNDGTLLLAFRDITNCRVQGIEPSSNIAQIATDAGVPTIQEFFDEKSINKILELSKAKVVTANNVFNHITDLRSFMINLGMLLADEGVFVFEVPALITFIKETAFDTMYLEHISYFGVKPLSRFFAEFGMKIDHVELNDYMGGSMRVFVSFGSGNSVEVDDFIASEDEAKIYDIDTYLSFMDRVKQLKMSLCKELYDVRSKGGRVVGIGAATKGNTLLNYCKLDKTVIDFITDSSPLKVGKYTPGSHIPILRDEDITDDITHAVILPWNIGEFLKNKLKHLPLEFIIPKIK
jgi:SAM-dependent methyltransferase